MKKDQKHTDETPFKESSDYFKQLENSILSKVEDGAKHLPIDVKHPFKADSEYFNQTEKRILSKVEKSAIHLPFGINHPFKAPEGYFQEIEKKVLTGTQERKTTQVSVFSEIWRNGSNYMRAAAAVFVIGAAGYYFLNGNNSAVSTEVAFTDFETETLVSYLENQELDIQDFASIIDENFEDSTLGADSFDEISEDELLQLIDIQYTNDI
jgi:hypothetical protein